MAWTFILGHVAVAPEMLAWQQQLAIFRQSVKSLQC